MPGLSSGLCSPDAIASVHIAVTSEEASDAVNPGREGRVPSEACQAPKDCEEDLLGEVVSLETTPEKSDDHRVHSRCMRVVELFKR